MNELIKTAWQRWQIIAKINGDYVARFIVNAFYFTIMVPFALISKFFTDPLEIKSGIKAHWRERKPVSAALDDARSQF